MQKSYFVLLGSAITLAVNLVKDCMEMTNSRTEHPISLKIKVKECSMTNLNISHKGQEWDMYKRNALLEGQVLLCSRNSNTALILTFLYKRSSFQCWNSVLHGSVWDTVLHLRHSLGNNCKTKFPPIYQDQQGQAEYPHKQHPFTFVHICE